jgi:hypothetical protein
VVVPVPAVDMMAPGIVHTTRYGTGGAQAPLMSADALVTEHFALEEMRTSDNASIG